MNDLLTQYLEISVLIKEGVRVEGKVSYSVSSDLQIT